jgi:hypothetical protein
MTQETATKKPWWKSRTLWVNALSTGFELAQKTGLIDLLPPGVAAVTANVITLILRPMTTKKLTTG